MKKDLSIKISIDAETGKVKVLNQEFKNLNTNINKTSKSAFGFSDALKTIGAVIAGLGIYELTKQVIDLSKSFIDTAAKFEQFSVALESIEGSSKVAQKSMEWIQNFAAKTPYQLDQVTEGFIKLRAYGLDAQKDLVWLGDTASAMGKPLNQAVEAIADAVNGEFERLKEFGVKGYQQGNKAALQWVTRSGEVKHIVIENNAKIIESTLKAIWNSRYAGAMEKQSKTWNGLLSTMQGNWQIFKNNIMKAGVFDYFKAILLVIKDKLEKAFKDGSKEGQIWAKNIINATKGVIEAFGGIIDSITYIKMGFVAIRIAWLVFKEGVLAGASVLEESLRSLTNIMIQAHNAIPGTEKWAYLKQGAGAYTQALKENTKEITKASNEFMELYKKTGTATDYAKKFLGDVEKKLKLLKTTTKNTKKDTTDYMAQLKKLGVVSDGVFSKFTSSTNRANKTLTKQSSIIKNLQAQLDSYLPEDAQIKKWYEAQKKAINDTFKNASEKEKALSLLKQVFVKKNLDLITKQNKIIADKQKSLMQSLQSEYNSFLPQDEQINIWYNKMKEKIKTLYADNADAMQKAIELLNNVKIKKIETLQNSNTYNVDGTPEESVYSHQNIMKYQKNLGESLTQHYDQTTMMKWVLSKTGTALNKGIHELFGDNKYTDVIGHSIEVLFNAISKHFDIFANIFKQALKFVFEDSYNKIKAKYEDTIDTLIQTTYTDKLKSNAYGVFGYGGYSKVANYNADVAHIKMLQEQNAMNYELSKKAKEYKETTQNILEAGSLALGAAAAVYFDGGAVIDGINNAIKSQDWAEQMTGFQNFQQAYIQGVEEYKQALRDLADEMISIAGDIYKSIDDYRNIYDKITGTNTYEMQKYAESLQYIGQYTKLTSDDLADFTQSILKADKSFVEGAVDSASSVDSLLDNNLFDKYGIAINSLNEKFKDSLSVVADLIDKQREANNAIKDYITELNTKIYGDNSYTLETTQADYAKALQQYNAGEIDVNELLDKAKAFENASGNDTDLLQKLASSLNKITKESTEDYLKGILEQVSTFNTVGLPDENIEDLTAPQEDTLDAIKDTNNFLEKLLGGFSSGSFLSGIGNALGNIIGVLGNILSVVTSGITSLLSGINNIVGSITDAVGNIVGSITDAIGGIVNGLGDVLGAAGHLVQDATTGVWSLATDVVGGAVDAVGDIFGGIGDALGGLFAKGGYTGTGTFVDSTGEKVAGIVHEGEWVAPKWMLEKNPDLFKVLEKARVNNTTPNFATTVISPIQPQNTTINVIEIQQTNSILQEQLSMQKKMYRLMQKFDVEGIKCNS